jgi:DNA repair protein RecO
MSDALDLLTEAKLLRRFRPAGKNLLSLYAGYYVAELLHDLTEASDPHPKLFDLADETLVALSAGEPVPRRMIRFELSMLKLLGLMPSLENCAECGNHVPLAGRIAFGLLDGGILCPSCRQGKSQVVFVNAGVLRTMAQLADPESKAWQRLEIDPRALGELRSVLNRRRTDAFEDFYETTLLSEATDPNLLYEMQTQLAAFPVYTEGEVTDFARVYFDSKATQDRLYALLAPIVERFKEVSKEEQHDFRGQLNDYVRLYAFLAQVLPFADADLEKLYVFARHLRRLLPADREALPREVQQNIDMESYRIQQTGSGKIALERKPGVLEPVGTKATHGTPPEELETLSRIIAELNERFGLNLGPEHRVTLGQIMEKLDEDAGLDAAARVNTRENVRLTFDQKVEHVIQEIVDSNFELYRRITDDRAFGEAVKNFLFDQYLRAHRNAEELIKRGESKTLEFKSTLRWNLKEDRQDDKGVTHAVLKTIAAFLNTEGGDLLIGVADDGSIVGIERDQLESDDTFMRHLAQVVRNGLGDRAGTCIDLKAQVVQGKTVCVVSCQRSPEPVFLKWKGLEATAEGDFFVRSGPGAVKLPPESAREYIRTRFDPRVAQRDSDVSSKEAVQQQQHPADGASRRS